MIVRVTMKTPDALDYAINNALNYLDDLDDERKEDEKEKAEKFAKKYFEYGEYLTVEMDTDKRTIKVIEK